MIGEFPYMQKPFPQMHGNFPGEDIGLDAGKPSSAATYTQYLGDAQFSDWMNNVLGRFMKIPKYDVKATQRNIDSSYQRSLGQMAPIRSSLKGMGVGAAEGTAALMGSLPLMQARAESTANLDKEQYNAELQWLDNLAGLTTQGYNIQDAGFDRFMDVLKLVEQMRQFNEQ